MLFFSFFLSLLLIHFLFSSDLFTPSFPLTLSTLSLSLSFPFSTRNKWEANSVTQGRVVEEVKMNAIAHSRAGVGNLFDIKCHISFFKDILCKTAIFLSLELHLQLAIF